MGVGTTNDRQAISIPRPQSVSAVTVDLTVSNSSGHSGLRGAAAWSGFWIGLGLLFGLWLGIHFGREVGATYLAAYLLEKSLSVDTCSSLSWRFCT
jgi:hypothetical protein